MVDATIVGMNVRRHAAGERMRARILVAMLELGEPVGMRRIAALAGCHYMTVKHHLPTLAADELIERAGRGWQLTKAGTAAAKLVPPRA